MYQDLEQLFEEIDELGRYDFDLPAMPRRSKVYLRDIIDPFEFYSDEEFRARYRFSKETVRNIILPEVIDGLRKFNNRGLPVTPELQLLIALRFYSTASFQVVSGDMMYISQPTICRIVARVSTLLAEKCHKYVHFPRSEDERRNARQMFEELGRSRNSPGLPNIIGAIDCTHIKISRPRGIRHSEVYRNRHTWFSVNVQAVVGPNMEIYDIVARWPGSSHDSRIFRNSRVHARISTDVLRGILVGDSGYAASRFMLTPLLNPGTPAEVRYNTAQIRTRNIVERVFGIWKKRFPCLSRGLCYKLTTTTKIIVACAVLHNMALMGGEEMEEGEDDGQVPLPDAIGHAAEGLAFRALLIRNRYG